LKSSVGRQVFGASKTVLARSVADFFDNILFKESADVILPRNNGTDNDVDIVIIKTSLQMKLAILAIL
jgi:hypothetical protein